MAYNDDVLSLSPVAYFALDESSGTAIVDSAGTFADGVYEAACVLGNDSLTPGGTGTSVGFNAGTAWGTVVVGSSMNFTQWSVSAWIKPTMTLNTVHYFAARFNSNFWVYKTASGYRVGCCFGDSSNSYSCSNSSGDFTDITLDDGNPHHVCFVRNATSVLIYVDNNLKNTISRTGGTISDTNDLYIGAVWNESDNNNYAGDLDALAFFNYALTAEQVELLYASSEVGAAAQSIPLLLEDYLYQDAQSAPLTLADQINTDAQSAPLTLVGNANTSAQSIPLTLGGVDATHYTAEHADWSLVVTLGGADLTSRVSGAIEIEHEEDASGICRFVFYPEAGSIDPDAYENQPVSVDFLGMSSGVESYRVRRYTGVVESALWDPMSGAVSISATTDMQGFLEQLDRETITAAIGGQWSEHVFDDSADGYQYAQDRLSTTAAEMHMNRNGYLVVTPIAAKSTADITITDAGRFNDTLTVRRAQKRNLLSRYRATIDYRFTRLRHREITVRWLGASFCDWANQGWPALPRNMVQQAADGTAWTRLSDITFEPYPPAGTYCTPLRGWIGDPDENLCLGATWTAGRRWAQTVTETYTLEVYAPDVAESVGELLLAEDYGIDATAESDDYEANTDFTGPPSGSSYSASLGDYYLNITASETLGRDALDQAHITLLERGKAEILKRSRQTVVRVSSLYVPHLDLSHTVQVTATGLTAKGKVRRFAESLDTETGRLDQTIEIAISRHGGSGLAVNDTIEAPDPPELTAESVTSRYYAVGIRLGGLSSSAVDNDDWDGYMANVAPGVRTGSNLYDRRFVVRMPQIEETARQSTESAVSASYEVAVPNDTLTFEA